MFKPGTANLFIDCGITISKLFGINVQYTVIKRYHYFKIKPPKALFLEVHTMVYTYAYKNAASVDPSI